MKDLRKDKISHDITNDTIYFFNENHSWGGGEKMFMWLSKKLYLNGYNVKYCMLYRNNDIDTAPIPTDYLDFKFFNSYILRNLWYFIIGAIKIIHYIKKNKVKNVVCFGFNSFYILGVLQHIMGFKLLVSERGDPEKKRWSKFRKVLFSGCNGAVFQTIGARKFYTSNKDEMSYIIPNPVVIPDEIWNDIDGQQIVISVGRIDLEQKRQDLLIEAFAKVVKKIPNSKLLLVGTGYDIDRLYQLIRYYKLVDNVCYVGFKKDVITYLKKANVFVLSSDFEGIPNALLEAMAFGMPVVSTDCTPGGAAYLIGKNENGILVPKGNPDLLACGIIEMLQNKEKRIYYAKKARESMIRFDELNIIKLWENVINRTFI